MIATTQENAVSIIGIDGILTASNCWKLGWDDRRRSFNNPNFSPRIQSDLLRELAAIRGKESLAQFGFDYLFQAGQHMFIKPEQCCLIFKKLDEFCRPHAIETDRGIELLQGKLFPDMPTFIIGMLIAVNEVNYTGVYLVSPNASGKGNAWVLNITDGIVSTDANQEQLVPLIEETNHDNTAQKPTALYKPKHDKTIGESPDEADTGGNTAS